MRAAQAVTFVAAIMGGFAVGGGVASAQQFTPITPPPVVFGGPPQAPVANIDPQLKDIADLLGILRTKQKATGDLYVGTVNILEYDAHGTFTDWETPGAKQVPLDRYTFNVSLFDNASRVTFQGDNTPETIRVVKGTRAWDEAWTKDNKLTTTPADANVAFRRTMMWLEPHAIIDAAVFAADGMCPDGRACTDVPKPTFATVNGKTVLTTTVEGNQYKVTIGPDKRPARVETTVNGKVVAANYFGYRNGTSLGQEALDKFHQGTYWPSRVTQEIDGKTVLDVVVTAGWSNPYSIYLDPEVLAKAQ